MARSVQGTETITEWERSERLKSAAHLERVHKNLCFEQGDHHEEVDTAFSRGADAIRAELSRLIPKNMPVTQTSQDETVLNALKDTVKALAPYVATLDAKTKHRLPYEHPLSAYDRAKDLLDKIALEETSTQIQESVSQTSENDDCSP